MGRGEIDSFNKEINNQVVYGNITTREREIYLPDLDQVVSVINITRQKEEKANQWQNTQKRKARLENLVKGSVGKMNKRKKSFGFTLMLIHLIKELRLTALLTILLNDMIALKKQKKIQKIFQNPTSTLFGPLKCQIRN